MKEKFYIFLDIDGTLNDWPYFMRLIESGERKKGGEFNEFNPNSIVALNYLIANLESKYDTQIVITSNAWRQNMVNTIKTFYSYNLKYKGTFDSTDFSKENVRGIEISDYLKHSESNKNYMVIDDETSDIKDYVSESKIIKTDLFKSSLTLKQVKDFLKTMHLNNDNTENLGK